MSFVLVGVLVGCVAVRALAQEVPPPGSAGGRPAGVPEAMEQQRAEQHEGGFAGFVHDHFAAIHKLAQAGTVGMLLNLFAAILVFLVLRAKDEARQAWRYGHMRVGLVFGIAAMAHGTAIDLAHLTGGQAKEVLNSGSWLCTMTFLVVLTGLLRSYGARPLQRWCWAHRLAVIAWLALLWWHLVPKLVH